MTCWYVGSVSSLSESPQQAETAREVYAYLEIRFAPFRSTVKLQNSQKRRAANLDLAPGGVDIAQSDRDSSRGSLKQMCLVGVGYGKKQHCCGMSNEQLKIARYDRTTSEYQTHHAKPRAGGRGVQPGTSYKVRVLLREADARRHRQRD